MKYCKSLKNSVEQKIYFTRRIGKSLASVVRYGVVVHKMVQEQRDMMVVFPHAYHAGFNHGFNMAEAVNFALPRYTSSLNLSTCWMKGYRTVRYLLPPVPMNPLAAHLF